MSALVQDQPHRSLKATDPPDHRQVVAAQGDQLRAQGRALPLCWLPESQERVVLGPMPGKRDDGKLWFE